jgi:predicted Rossmann fold flavoprotein
MSAYALAVVGAGPAGLFMAQAAAQGGLRPVLVREKMEKPGKKLLLTGGGGCNFTHRRPIQEFLGCYGGHGRFLKPALLNFTNQDAVNFFEASGVSCLAEEATGKVFPRSRKSADILKALLSACHREEVELRCGQGVSAIALAPDGFKLSCGPQDILARRVAITTGGCSFPGSGSTGDGYGLAQRLGHGLVPPRPGLAAVLLDPHPLASLPGTSFKDLRASQWRAGRKLRGAQGDLLITHQGLSGPLIHNLSRWLEPGDLLRLDLAGLDADQGFPAFSAGFDACGLASLKDLLQGLPLTQALRERLLDLAGAAPQALPQQVPKAVRRRLFELLSAFPAVVARVADFESAMVTCGGVPLDEVDPKTMASRKVAGLYFAGEVLDVDGDSGGYDLQAAWSTAALAAKAMARAQSAG